MVVALGPGKFYGSSLPRPHIYTDVKMNEDGIRVDPPMGIMEPLLSWAYDSHWSMGGLSFKRLRLQGKIEGNIKKLRSDHKKKGRLIKKNLKNKSEELALSPPSSSTSVSDSPPPAPAAIERRRLTFLLNDDDSSGSETDKQQPSVVVSSVTGSSPSCGGGRRSGLRLRLGGKKQRARKLVDDFDRVALDSSDSLLTKGSPEKTENRSSSEKEKETIGKSNSNGKKRGSTNVVVEEMVEVPSSISSRSRRSSRRFSSNGDDEDDSLASLVKPKSVGKGVVMKGSSKDKNINKSSRTTITAAAVALNNNATPPPPAPARRTRTSPRLSSGTTR